MKYITFSKWLELKESEVPMEPVSSPESIVDQEPVMPKVPMCVNCGVKRKIPGERYCKDCRKQILQKMKDDGYLKGSSRYFPGSTRGQDSREDRRSTQFGVD